MIKDWIAKYYYILWHDCLQRLEPFTFQFRRIAKKYPLVWFLILLAPNVGVFYETYKKRWWGVLWWSLIAIFFDWLIIHLGGFW
jgi:hypothetical protein